MAMKARLFLRRCDGWCRCWDDSARRAARASRLKRSSDCGSRAEIVGKKFQRDEAAEARVFGFIDDAHPTTAEFFDRRGNGK